MSEKPSVPDSVDSVVAAWARERPDLDLTAIGIVGRLGRAALLLRPEQERVFTEFGLQRGEFDVLATLRRAGEPYILTPSQLSATLLLTRAGMTNRIDRLVASGLVERTLDPNDRRSFHVRLTEKGFTTVDEAMTAHTANVTRLLAALPATGQAALEDLLRTLLHTLEAPDGRAAG
ncbi:MarR family transcriptional regulator [Nocardia flavorosea]|uniref:MarR family winged helix-turn-helix transcriptional regulator n=1 Tax=Nocardia flavorosea TaxID=53429 RepID=UPI0018938CB5|nr:MarR family transcriptional regulator [Nocardia flavorosea]MBF6352089.1 MarR family transcriptional regulator [Nocardia flavorosea]